jgi:N-acetylmuramoyl-L-alanine amidase
MKKKTLIIISAALLALAAAAVGIYLALSPAAPVLRDNYTPKTDIICIDPGHGGDDPGAINGDRCEKDDNLALALLVAKYVEELGCTPLLTRGEDSYLTLGDRCEIANDAEAAYFVSLHRNSAAESAKGVEVWISSQKTAPERELAQNIMQALEEVEVQSSRGVKAGTQASPDNDYAVNKNTDMPSCIVELGFITNAEDNRLYDKYLDSYARAIAEAIADTFE